MNSYIHGESFPTSRIYRVEKNYNIQQIFFNLQKFINPLSSSLRDCIWIYYILGKYVLTINIELGIATIFILHTTVFYILCNIAYYEFLRQNMYEKMMKKKKHVFFSKIIKIAGYNSQAQINEITVSCLHQYVFITGRTGSNRQ